MVSYEDSRTAQERELVQAQSKELSVIGSSQENLMTGKKKKKSLIIDQHRVWDLHTFSHFVLTTNSWGSIHCVRGSTLTETAHPGQAP